MKWNLHLCTVRWVFFFFFGLRGQLRQVLRWERWNGSAGLSISHPSVFHHHSWPESCSESGRREKRAASILRAKQTGMRRRGKWGESCYVVKEENFNQKCCMCDFVLTTFPRYRISSPLLVHTGRVHTESDITDRMKLQPVAEGCDNLFQIVPCETDHFLAVLILMELLSQVGFATS